MKVSFLRDCTLFKIITKKEKKMSKLFMKRAGEIYICQLQRYEISSSTGIFFGYLFAKKVQFSASLFL